MSRNLLALVLVVVFVMGSCLGDVPRFIAKPCTEEMSVALPNMAFTMEIGNDILVHHAIQNFDTYLVIRRLDASGKYKQIYSSTDYPTMYPKTNGVWVASPGESLTAMLQILDNDQIVFKSALPRGYQLGSFFAENVFVGNVMDNVFRIYTLDSEWTETSEFTALGMPFPADGRLTQDQRFMIVYNDTHITIYEYQPVDVAFTVVEAFVYNSTYNLHAIYNGVDTVVVMTDAIEIETEQGVIFGGGVIYEKVSGSWIEKQKYDGVSLGAKPDAYLGTTGTFYNAHTLVLPAPTENYVGVDVTETGPMGTIYILGRDASGTWSQIYQVGANEKVRFGYNVLFTETSMIVAGFGFNLNVEVFGHIFSINKCIGFPINVTCNNAQLDDCSNIVFDELYLINEVACGPVDVTVSSMDLTQSNEATVTYNFAKEMLRATCNATITCPASPVSGSTPMGSTVPLGGSSPTGKTSAASNVVVFGGLLLAPVIFAM